MRSTERLRALRDWCDANLCEGRMMKAPAPDMNIMEIVKQRPRVFLGWLPSRPDATGLLQPNPLNVCPGILIMPSSSYAKNANEGRFDRYDNVKRSSSLGQTLSVSILFSVYEPGNRLSGFIDNTGAMDFTKLEEGTEEGLFTLMNWMDDCVSGLLAQKTIPHSDMFLSDADLVYSLYTDQSYVVDKRPIYYGFVNAKFYCYADDRNNTDILNMLS